MKLSLDRKRKTKDPCEICFLHRTLCICSAIPSLNLKTRVVLIIHSKELKRTTNTGRLALHALENSKMVVRGLDHEALNLSPLLEESFDSYLLYPSEDAVEMTSVLHRKNPKPIQLLVPDGNWRQASKVSIRHPELKNILRVKISKTNFDTEHLRKEHMAHGYSTLEAIAEALGIIEGDEVRTQLNLLYRAKLEATLKGRGIKV